MEPTADTLLDAGGATNEDRLTVLDGAAWVLDGTSGFSDRSITAHPESDGVWFVERVDDYLRDHVHDEASLTDVVAGAIEYVASALVEESTVPRESPSVEDAGAIGEVPAATIALVRWDESADSLEYYSLGDSAAVVETADGAVDYHDEGGPERFDRALRERVAEYVADNPGADYEELRAELRPHIRQFRKHREVPGGFWCLGINPVSARQGRSGEYDLGSVVSVTLFTDGFTQAVDLFDLYDDWGAAVDDIRARGVAAVVSDLREAQRRQGVTERPRLKPMDDVAVVHLDY